MNPYSTELAHHGILGQRWGKKNGPPYPLDAEDHSAAEKAANYTKSIKKTVSNKSKELASKTKETINDPDKRKDLIRKGIAGAAIGLAVAGTYAVIRNEVKVEPKVITKYNHLMPIYGAKGKMIFPPRMVPYHETVMVPRYVTKGHTSVNKVMSKIGKGFDMTKFTFDELKQLGLR